MWLENERILNFGLGAQPFFFFLVSQGISYLPLPSVMSRVILWHEKRARRTFLALSWLVFWKLILALPLDGLIRKKDLVILQKKDATSFVWSLTAHGTMKILWTFPLHYCCLRRWFWSITDFSKNSRILSLLPASTKSSAKRLAASLDFFFGPGARFGD